MQASKGLRQLCIISRQATKPAGPGETAFHDPALRQQYESFFRLGQLDDLQLPMLGLCILRGLVPRIPLVDIRDVHRIARHVLDLRGQMRHLPPLLDVGRGDMQRQEVPQGIDGHMDFTPACAFGPVIAGPGTALGRRLQRGCYCPNPARVKWTVNMSG
jgi:hypothetical protein